MHPLCTPGPFEGSALRTSDECYQVSSSTGDHSVSDIFCIDATADQEDHDDSNSICA